MTIQASDIGEDGEVNPHTPPLHEVLDDMLAFHRRFVHHEDDNAHAIVVLWSVHTWVVQSFSRTPRLYIHSPEPGCGKSTQGDLIRFFSYKPIGLVGTTAAVIYRLIDKEAPTLIIDEVDTVFSSNQPGTDIIKSILNAGYAFGEKVYRVNPNTMNPEGFCAFAPVALVGIDNRAMPDTILTRSIPIRMTRATRATDIEVWDKFDHDDYREFLEEQLPRLLDVVPFREKPDLPENLTNRDAEVWRALFSLANAVGGQWPERVAKASGSLHWEATTSEQAKVLLVTREIFDAAGVDGIAAQDLTERINKVGQVESLSAKGLNSILAAYGVSPKKTNGKSTYRRADLETAWNKWLDPVEDAEPGTPDAENLPILPNEEPEKVVPLKSHPLFQKKPAPTDAEDW